MLSNCFELSDLFITQDKTYHKKHFLIIEQISNDV